MTVLVLMGVSGCGKSSLAAELVRRLGWPFQEGDDLHPAANIAKMRAGIPLDDGDRLPWLDAVAAWIDARRAAGENGIVTCSNLKRAYRDLTVGRRRGVRLVYLKGDRELIAARLAGRRGHYMPAALLDSQFAALEEPGPDEDAIVLPVAAPVAELAAALIARLTRCG